jgi:hypothetical protein
VRSFFYRAMVAGACKVDPTPFIVSRRLREQPAPRCRLALVYTGRSPDSVRVMVEDAISAGFDVRLWALREIDHELASLTVGSGVRSRLELHNRLLGSPGDDWLVVADDDVRFRHGTVADLVRAAAMLGLDIAQPAHEQGSHRSHRLTRRLPFHAARLTTFVECGPVVAFSPRVASWVLPFPDYGMGWGVELMWHDLQTKGFRLGIVDAVSIMHLFPAATSYDHVDEQERLTLLLRERGLSSLAEMQSTVKRIPPWPSRWARRRG